MHRMNVSDVNKDSTLKANVKQKCKDWWSNVTITNRDVQNGFLKFGCFEKNRGFVSVLKTTVSSGFFVD